MKEYFPGIPAVQFEGSYASHPFSFRFYDPERIVAGKPMREQLRFALPVGAAARFGHAGQDYLMASMELLHKLGLQLYTLRDRSLAQEAPTLRESNARMDESAEVLVCLQEAYGARALQVSADLSSHPRYCYGAATSYSADIYAYAAAQTKKALELAWRLGALQFCFSGEQECRDGFYPSVNDALETDNLLRMLAMLGNYAAELGYSGSLSVRPGAESSREPYWPTASQALAFLRQGGLDGAYRVDLPGEAPCAELRTLLQADRLGVLRVSPALPAAYETLFVRAVPTMLELLRFGGLRGGGIILDVPHRTCATAEDYVIHCILHMDAYAYGLMMAQRVLLDGRVEQLRRERYSGFYQGVGRSVLENRADLYSLEAHALQRGMLLARTGREDYMEHVVQGLMYRGV